MPRWRSDKGMPKLYSMLSEQDHDRLDQVFHGTEHFLRHPASQLKGDREGLLVDTGAFGNLVGDEWVKRQTAIAALHGHATTSQEMKNVLSVGGVGKGDNKCHTRPSRWKVRPPILNHKWSMTQNCPHCGA